MAAPGPGADLRGGGRPERELMIEAGPSLGGGGGALWVGAGRARGILEVGALGVVTATVLLAGSPHAEQAVAAWRQEGNGRLALGWHPCLTLDGPVSPPGEVPSLLGSDGRFWTLKRFLIRL